MRNKVIIYLGINKWGTIKQRPQHLAEKLSTKNTVVYINPGITITEYIKSLGMVNYKFIDRLNKNFLIIQPSFSFPFSNFPNRASLYINNKLINISIKKFLEQNKLKPDILWLSHPTQTHLLDEFKGMIRCYDCMDDHSLISGNYQEKIDKLEEDMLKNVDIVFASSSKLVSKCSKLNKSIYLIPNGADVSHFNPDKTSCMERQSNLLCTREPLIGFIGAISNWVDLELIKYVADSRPKWSIVMIGPICTNIKKIKNTKNITFLGEIPYLSLPNYINEFSVCLIPFKVNELTKAVDPVKLYEYLATGKPIVATDLPELHKYSSVCRIAKNKEEFLMHIEGSLNEKDLSLAKKRIIIATENSWEKRAEAVLDIFTEKIGL